MCQQRSPFFSSYNVVTHVDTRFLQSFLWDRLGAITPKPVEFSTVQMVEIVVEEANGKQPCMLRARRWLSVKQAINKSLAKVIVDEKNFNFRPYVSTPRCVAILSHLELHNQEIVTSPQEVIYQLGLAMIAIVTPTLLPTKSESGVDKPGVQPAKGNEVSLL